MPITRRQFIARTGLATAGAFFGPSLFRNPFLRQAIADQLDTLDRYVVLVFLDGGNDGLNTVTPLGDSGASQLRYWYEQARSAPSPTNSGGLRLGIPNLQATQIGNDPHTGTPLALHPGLAGLWNLWNTYNALAVIQGCGDPNSLNFLSHEFSRTIWQTGNPYSLPTFGGGWLGRYLGANYHPSDIPAVCISDLIAGELVTPSTSVLAMTSVDDFGFPYDDWDLDLDKPFKHDAFNSLYTSTKSQAQPAFAFLKANGTATLGASDSYPPVSDLYSNDPARAIFDAQYQGLIDNNGNGFAADIREVAKIIYGVSTGAPNVKARAFELSNGGYDTHSDQGTDKPDESQLALHQQVGDALNVFYQDCVGMGIADKLCIVVWSEFSRRIQQNLNGTDHGSQGPVFVIGGAVNGGVYGNHPNINSDPNVAGPAGGDGALNGDGNTAYSQDPSDPFRSTDIRDVYGTILKHWLNITDPTTLLPLDGGDPTQYWTVPNFDLPFLT